MHKCVFGEMYNSWRDCLAQSEIQKNSSVYIVARITTYHIVTRVPDCENW